MLNNIQLKYRIGFLYFLLSLLVSISVKGQSSWTWKDPNDFGLIDFGDNKVIAYNFIGLGLAELFDKGGQLDSSNIWSVSMGHYPEYRRAPLSSLSFVEGRVGRQVRRYLTWGAGSRIYLVGGEGVHTSGFGTHLWFSWHLINSHKFKLSYDNGVGPNYFFDPFPNGGTRFNFTTHYGLAFSFLINGRWFSVDFSNVHISNANIKGADRNPAMDAIGVRIELQF